MGLIHDDQPNVSDHPTTRLRSQRRNRSHHDFGQRLVHIGLHSPHGQPWRYRMQFGNRLINQFRRVCQGEHPTPGIACQPFDSEMGEDHGLASASRKNLRGPTHPCRPCREGRVHRCPLVGP
jgi:hypothetical protein